MNVRTATEDDVPAVVDVINRHAQEIYGESELSEDEIGHWFRLPNIWIRVAQQEGGLCGYADGLRPNEESPLSVYLCALDPDAARALLAAAEEHAGGGLVHVFVQGEDSSVARVLEEGGYAPARHSFRMLIELDGELPEPAWPDGIAVRTFRPGEERRMYEANNAAFADEWYFAPFPFDEWLEVQAGRPSHDPSLWWVAEAGDELAGFSRNSWAFSGDPEHGWVNSLGVLPPYRRRGLGEALLRHSFRDFRERGATQVSLGVDSQNETGAVRLYERVGMHIHRRSTTWEKGL
jgi:mycothiol synthase